MNNQEFSDFIDRGGSVAMPVDLDAMPVGTTFVTMAGASAVRMEVTDRVIGGCHGPDCDCVQTDVSFVE